MDDEVPAEPRFIADHDLSRPQDNDVMGDLRRVCRDVVGALSASGAGLSVMAENGVHGIATASDPSTALIEEFQFTFGEGPCVDAFDLSRPVLVPNLAEGAGRWPVYAAAAHDAGIRAVFAFPLQVGAARLGVLDVFRTRAGSLSRDELGQALTFADVAVTTLLDGQEHATAGRDGLSGAIEPRAELFQAQGMVMVQLGVTITEALVRMRAYAYAENRPLNEVAADIVARRLQFDRDDT
jgi:hypothetical protein